MSIKPITRDIEGVLKALYAEYGRRAPGAGGDPVGGLIRTICSQHTSDKNSSRAYSSLKTRFPSWDEIADAPVDAVESAIRPGGLGKQKAPRICGILRRIRQERGEINLDYLRDMTTENIMTELCRFPGVGAKTAACVALFELGRDICPVDTHVHRVTSRLGWIPAGQNAVKAQELLAALLPKGEAGPAHPALIRHGRKRCRPKPQCGPCPIKIWCAHEKCKADDR